MPRLAKILLLTLLVLSAISVVIILGFRFWASMRETTETGTNAPGYFANVGNLQLHYMKWGPDSKTPIVLIPGTLAWAGTWSDMAERLAAKGHHVVALDLPPFGFSERPGNGDYSRQAQAKRILSFIDALGLEDTVLVGHSFGGGATVEAALIDPERFCALGLLDIALRLDSPAPAVPLAPLFAFKPLRTALMSATFTNPLLIGKGLRDFIENDALVTKQRIAIYRKPLDRADTSAAVGDWFLSGLFGDERESLSTDGSNYKRFNRQAFIIWGRNDTVTPLAQGHLIDALLPRSQLNILGGVNHIPQVENPQSVAGIIHNHTLHARQLGCE